ncbi:MAG: type II secretion system F family protein [Planctomycetota bacterium]
MANSLALAYHNLSIMLDAGVPLLRSLNTVSSALDPHTRVAFLRLVQSASKGNTLAETMTQSPSIFNPVDVTIIQAAETSGNLPESFKLLSQWHEFSGRIRKKMLSGMFLPILLLHATAFIAPFPGFVLGGWQIGPYLTSVVTILLLFYIPAVIIFIILRITPKTGLFRRLLDRLTLKIPLLGRAVYKLALSRYCWVFHMLTKAGVPITDCAERAASATTNAVVTDLVKPAAASAKAGRPVSDGFGSKLPMDFLEIWRVGEETGKLDDVTKRLADDNAEAAEFWFTEFARWLPRVIYCLVCLLMLYYIFVNFSKIMTTVPQGF